MITATWTEARGRNTATPCEEISTERRDFLTKLAHPTADTFAMKGVAPHELKYFMEQIETFYEILTRER